jgi:hypothetical protein
MEILAKGVKLDFLINCMGEGIIVGCKVKCPMKRLVTNSIRAYK